MGVCEQWLCADSAFEAGQCLEIATCKQVLAAPHSVHHSIGKL